MFVIPFRVGESECSVFIGLDEEGFERMKNYDPSEIQIAQLPLAKLGLAGFSLKEVLIGYCSDKDAEHVSKLMMEANSVKPGLEYLTRGWKFRPELGDHDGPPLSMIPDPEDSVQ